MTFQQRACIINIEEEMACEYASFGCAYFGGCPHSKRIDLIVIAEIRS